MGSAFPGLLGRRVRFKGIAGAAWLGRVVGWDDGYLVVEAANGQLEQYGFCTLDVEPAATIERPAPTG